MVVVMAVSLVVLMAVDSVVSSEILLAAWKAARSAFL